jgi:hypothetical protein
MVGSLWPCRLIESNSNSGSETQDTIGRALMMSDDGFVVAAAVIGGRHFQLRLDARPAPSN